MVQPTVWLPTNHLLDSHQPLDLMQLVTFLKVALLIQVWLIRLLLNNLSSITLDYHLLQVSQLRTVCQHKLNRLWLLRTTFLETLLTEILDCLRQQGCLIQV
jgi:hypothetical protein